MSHYTVPSIITRKGWKIPSYDVAHYNFSGVEDISIPAVITREGWQLPKYDVAHYNFSGVGAPTEVAAETEAEAAGERYYKATQLLQEAAKLADTNPESARDILMQITVQGLPEPYRTKLSDARKVISRRVLGSSMTQAEKQLEDDKIDFFVEGIAEDIVGIRNVVSGAVKTVFNPVWLKVILIGGGLIAGSYFIRSFGVSAKGIKRAFKRKK